MSSSSSPSDTPAKQSPPAKRGGALNVVLVLLLVVQLGLAAVAGGRWWLGQGKATAAVAGGPAPPIAATPGAVPPLPAITLASAPAAAVAGGPAAAEQLPALVGSLGERLAALPVEGAAPAHLVVLGSGQQTVEKISEIPRHERWEFQFPPGNSVESYARQLEYFHIELGLIGGSDQITYVTNLADPTPKSRTGPAADEQRLYLVWLRGSMRDADEQLISKAKLPLADRLVAHFCPPELENQLVQLEDAAAKAANLARIRKTVFAVRANEFGGYRLHVLEQKGD